VALLSTATSGPSASPRPPRLWPSRRCGLHRQPSPITALAFSRDGKRLVTAHTNRTLRVLDAETTRLTATLRGPEAPVTLARVDPKGRRLVAASQDRAAGKLSSGLPSTKMVSTSRWPWPTVAYVFGDRQNAVDHRGGRQRVRGRASVCGARSSVGSVVIW
jgi:WD40 repeat protein